ncbi:MAG: cysteine hydrolase family protein [bacterium]|jgi:nicotinamidase-related amidase
MSVGLVLIDIQNDYFPGGRMELVEVESAARNAAKILQMFRHRHLPVFHIKHVSMRPDASFFLPGTPGVNIHDSVTPSAGEPVIEKQFPNSFRGTPLLDRLKSEGIGKVIICGAMSHMCVDATTRAAFDFGFSCTVIEDGCATRDLQFKGEIVKADKVHAAFMSALSAPYAKVMGTADFIKAEPGFWPIT